MNGKPRLCERLALRISNSVFLASPKLFFSLFFFCPVGLVTPKELQEHWVGHSSGPSYIDVNACAGLGYIFNEEIHNI